MDILLAALLHSQPVERIPCPEGWQLHGYMLQLSPGDELESAASFLQDYKHTAVGALLISITKKITKQQGKLR